MSRNQILAIATGVMALLSIFSYNNSQNRAVRFERGQKFLPNLNPDEIVEATITKDGETTHLKRADKEFVLVTSHGYPAKNEAVNRFVRDILNLSLEKEVGSGESLEKELNVMPDGAESTRVVFKNQAGKAMVDFVVGKELEGGSGSYIKRMDGEDSKIYLTSNRAYINTGADAFIKKELLNIEQADIQRISGPDYVLEDQDGTLKLTNVPQGKKESANVSQIKSAITNLTFDKVFVADDPEVASLNFQPRLTYDLKNQAHYTLALASKGERTFLRISAVHDLRSINPAELESDDAVKEKSEQWEAAVKVQEYSQFHGSWVYELNESSAKKFLHNRSELIEDEEKKS